jgi:hypothetical protein
LNPYIPILESIIAFEIVFFASLVLTHKNEGCGTGMAFADLFRTSVRQFCMRVKAGTIIGWVDTNLPPLTWRIIAMKQMKILLKHKISPAKIDGDTYFNAEIVEAIRKMIKADYHKELPNVYL